MEENNVIPDLLMRKETSKASFTSNVQIPRGEVKVEWFLSLSSRWKGNIGSSTPISVKYLQEEKNLLGICSCHAFSIPKYETFIEFKT